MRRRSWRPSAPSTRTRLGRDSVPGVTQPDTLEEPPATGDEAVDAALATLEGVVDEPLETRLAVLERVHRTLQDRLADVED